MQVLLPNLNANLSDGCQAHCHLKALNRVLLVPDRDSQRGEWMLQFDRIDTIEIHDVIKRDGVRYYVLDIYYRQSNSRIPTNRRKRGDRCGEPTADRKPDVRTERRFSEFVELRSALYNNAYEGHPEKACQFCHDIIRYVATSCAQPTLFTKWSSSTDKMAHLLTIFTRDILTLTLNCLATSDMEACQGQTTIPRLVHDFIVGTQPQ